MPNNKRSIAIDPLASDLCLAEAVEGLNIVAVINTHEHMDHIGGNEAIINATNCKLYAHKNAKHKIPNMNYGLEAGQIIEIW